MLQIPEYPASEPDWWQPMQTGSLAGYFIGEKIMANENVMHTCGHEQIHQISGKSDHRHNKMNWLKTTLCTECWKKDQQAKKDKNNAAALDFANNQGWPDITGSPAQVSWAIRIRHVVLLQLNKASETDPVELQKIEEIKSWLLNKTKSEFWIEGKNYRNPSQLNPIALMGAVFGSSYHSEISAQSFINLYHHRLEIEAKEDQRNEREEQDKQDLQVIRMITNNPSIKVTVWRNLTEKKVFIGEFCNNVYIWSNKNTPKINIKLTEENKQQMSKSCESLARRYNSATWK